MVGSQIKDGNKSNIGTDRHLDLSLRDLNRGSGLFQDGFAFFQSLNTHTAEA